MSKENPVVSVVISTYNRPKFLDEALTSIGAQTFDDFEVVLCDDHSPPAGIEFPPAYREVLDKHGELLDKRGVDLWAYRLGENSGYQCMPKNRAIEKAAGDYIAYLDDDNTWHPEHLSVAVNALEYSPADETEKPGTYSKPNFSTDMVYTRLHYDVTDESLVKPMHNDDALCHDSMEDDRIGVERRCKMTHIEKSEKLRDMFADFAGDAPGTEWNPRRLTVANFVDTSTIVHSKGAFWRMVRETGYGWDESLRRFGDWNFVWRWAMSGNNAKLIDKVTVNYRLHAKGLQITRQPIEVPVCLSYEQYRQYGREIRTL